jgi:exonuclease VII large subunit
MNGDWDAKTSALEKRIEDYTRRTKSVVDNLERRMQAEQPNIKRQLADEATRDALREAGRFAAKALEQLQARVNEAKKHAHKLEFSSKSEPGTDFNFGR